MNKAMYAEEIKTLRKHHPGHYMVSLLVKEPMRSAFLAGLAFDDALNAVILRQKEPILVQMRFTWWDETLILIKAENSEKRKHPLVKALRNIDDAYLGHDLAYNLLSSMIKAYEERLHFLQPTSFQEFSMMAGRPFVALNRLWLHILACGDEAWVVSEDILRLSDRVSECWGMLFQIQRVQGFLSHGQMIFPANLTKDKNIIMSEFYKKESLLKIAEMTEICAQQIEQRLLDMEIFYRQVPCWARVVFAFIPLGLILTNHLKRCNYRFDYKEFSTLPSLSLWRVLWWYHRKR